MKKFLLLPILLCWILFSTVEGIEKTKTPRPESPDVSALLEEINGMRVHYGLDALEMDDNLNSAAERQVEYIRDQQKLMKEGPSGESLHIQAEDSGYAGGHPFVVEEAMAKIWVDTGMDYLVNEIWKQEQISLHALMNTQVRHIGIGIADAADKHRYVLVLTAGMTDGAEDYSVIATYDFRTPKPELSSTPTIPPMQRSTPDADGGLYHTVMSGETFSEIAFLYGLDWYTLSNLNGIKWSETVMPVVYEGQVLVIQPTFTATPTATPTKTPFPSTNTPRPTFTATMSLPAEAINDHPGRPPFDFVRISREIDSVFAPYVKPIAITMITLSALGLIVLFIRKKED